MCRKTLCLSSRFLWVSVGSLRGLLVRLLFECKPLVHSSQERHPLGGGPPKRLVVIVRHLPIKALTALISRRWMGLVRGLVILPMSVWWTVASRRFLFELVFLALRLDGVRNSFRQFTNKVKFLGFRFTKQEPLHRIRVLTELSYVGDMCGQYPDVYVC